MNCSKTWDVHIVVDAKRAAAALLILSCFGMRLLLDDSFYFH